MPRAATGRRNRFRQTPQRRHTVRRTTPIESDDGGTQIETVTTTNTGRNRTVERRTPISTGGSQVESYSESDNGDRSNSGRSVRRYSPTAVGRDAGGVGLLEAEFLAAIMLQVLLLFGDTDKSYADKIMQTMKRGTMIALLFFILALMSGIGPNVARVSKAIGGLVVVAILLTSPIVKVDPQTGQATGVLPNLDKFFKADWTSTGEHGTDVGQTSTPDKSGTSGQALHAAEGAINRITEIINSFGFGLIK